MCRAPPATSGSGPEALRAWPPCPLPRRRPAVAPAAAAAVVAGAGVVVAGAEAGAAAVGGAPTFGAAEKQAAALVAAAAGVGDPVVAAHRSGRHHRGRAGWRRWPVRDKNRAVGVDDSVAADLGGAPGCARQVRGQVLGNFYVGFAIRAGDGIRGQPEVL